MKTGQGDGKRTKSFSLSHEAARCVERSSVIHYPRRDGGRSRGVSQAIVWYCGVSVATIIKRNEKQAATIAQLEARLAQKSGPLGGGIRAIVARIWPF